MKRVFSSGGGGGGGEGGLAEYRGIEGISRQSNPVNTDIDGAVEARCPY